MSGPRLIADTVPRIAGTLFAKKYVMLGRLVTRWPEIVGADLAGRVQPVKIRRGKDRGGQSIAILDIAASPSESTVLHYRRDLMLERINYIFGEALVGAIRFVPTADILPAPPPRRRAVPLTPVQTDGIEESVAAIGDAGLRDSLRRLGAAILQDGNAGI